ncbi:ComEA family DNA-binding protein [Actinomadura macrotermitis]|uniref:ComEA family DNA-binding protein n=1 Tax=Actinomadura macrotermitis TaxID=2585200 RepID=UPI00129678AE|nr:helix-hairpin-helix domain-containing protein [Actinomadura macrotermitis]
MHNYPNGHFGPSGNTPPPYPPRPPRAHRPPPGPQPPYPMPPLVQPVPVGPQDAPQGLLWAFTPFLTFGFGTPFSFLYAAVRRGSWNLGATAAGYGLATLGALVLMDAGSILGPLGALMMLMLWIAGTAHAFAVRPSVFPRGNPRNRVNEHAVQAAKYRKVLRDEARTLAAEDPALAHELRIGRPDLPRAYDDGGLVDVNHAPPAALGQLPGMTGPLVERIVARRSEQGGFVSAEEMAVDIDLPPGMLPAIAEYAIFLA